MKSPAQKEKYKRLITAISIITPIAVISLYGVNLKDLGFDVKPLKFLPPIYATINGVTAIILIAAVISIKKGNKKLHEQLNTIAIFLSLLFLIMYIAYHITSDPVKFEGKGLVRYFYYFILITHIILSITVIPYVLIAYMRAKLGNFKAHKKIAKITFPMWLYVAVTGVIVYILISPYYV